MDHIRIKTEPTHKPNRSAHISDETMFPEQYSPSMSNHQTSGFEICPEPSLSSYLVFL
ncbi:hypothetical protein Hanom_Chr01g00047851 [Helianthus anomalus]